MKVKWNKHSAKDRVMVWLRGAPNEGDETTVVIGYYDEREEMYKCSCHDIKPHIVTHWAEIEYPSIDL